MYVNGTLNPSNTIRIMTKEEKSGFERGSPQHRKKQRRFQSWKLEERRKLQTLTGKISITSFLCTMDFRWAYFQANSYFHSGYTVLYLHNFFCLNWFCYSNTIGSLLTDYNYLIFRFKFAEIFKFKDLAYLANIQCLISCLPHK
jgi:hypothetical protein